MAKLNPHTYHGIFSHTRTILSAYIKKRDFRKREVLVYSAKYLSFKKTIYGIVNQKQQLSSNF